VVPKRIFKNKGILGIFGENTKIFENLNYMSFSSKLVKSMGGSEI